MYGLCALPPLEDVVIVLQTSLRCRLITFLSSLVYNLQIYISYPHQHYFSTIQGEGGKRLTKKACDSHEQHALQSIFL